MNSEFRMANAELRHRTPRHDENFKAVGAGTTRDVLRSSQFAIRNWISTGLLTFCIAAASAAQDAEKPKRGDWTMWGGSPDRNMVSDETGIPGEWDIKAKKNLKWSAPLGSQTYGNVVVHKGKIFVGTNNGGEFRKEITGDKGVVLCFNEADGKLLWQATHDKMPTGQVNDWPEQGICSSPLAIGDRIYYVSNRCEIVCADVEGMTDGENDGPYTSEKYKDKMDGDFIWIVDMFDEMGVFPHNLATASPVSDGKLIFVGTSNGVDEGHINIPKPTAPDFVAVDKDTGKVAWTKNLTANKIFHGQWSSPSYGVIGGKPQVIYGAGDGWCYAMDPRNGDVIWKFNLNPPDAKYILGGRGTANEVIATPVIVGDHVYVCVGQDPEHGEGIGHFYCIDATKTGDITRSGKVWHVGGEEFRRSISTCAVKDGLVYAADLSGFLYCFDAKTGQKHWTHDTFAAVWGSPYVVDGKVMLGTESGEVFVLQQGKELKVLGTMDLITSVYTTPVAANGVLYINNRNTLYAIAGK